jgi:hypothetical protein
MFVKLSLALRTERALQLLRHSFIIQVKILYTVNQSFSTGWSLELIFWWSKPLLQEYYGSIWVDKLCYFLFCGYLLTSVENQ